MPTLARHPVGIVLILFLSCSAQAAEDGLPDTGYEQTLKAAEPPSETNAEPSANSAGVSCPPGAKLVTHSGKAKCAWESDLKALPKAGPNASGPSKADLWLCVVVGHVVVWDYSLYKVVYCINLTKLFEPCGKCADGKKCRFANGQSKCVYECGADEVGGGQQQCRSCGDGEVPNAAGTACEKCEHGESSTGGTCNPDPCEGVTCPKNAHCSGGQCQCDVGYRETHRLVGTPGEPEPVLKCVRDPCHGKVCGKNSVCSNGQCGCESGYEDPDGDGDCAKPCTQDAYDTRAKSSLMSIEADPWEQGEAYSCVNGTVTVGSSRTNESNYLYTDYPTNSEKNPNAGDVCALGLGLGMGGGGHSHPHFVWPRDKGVQCGSSSKDVIDSKKTVQMTNAANVNFSSNDKNAAKDANNGDGRPLYLVVPNRNCVKVYRKNEKDRWQQSGCL